MTLVARERDVFGEFAERVKIMKDPLYDEGADPKYLPEYRAWIRRVRCVACNRTYGRNQDGQTIEPEGDYERTLYDLTDLSVSDAHHVKTRGSGGVDPRNLVPLCRFHHSELHTIGRPAFELGYNFSMQDTAAFLYEKFKEGITATSCAEEAHRLHVEFRAQCGTWLQNVYKIGAYFNQFKTQTIGGKKIYEWLGFFSLEEYIEAPEESCGLGMSWRTLYRYAKLAELQDRFGTETASVIDMGPTKASTLAPVLEAIEDPEEREDIIRTATALSNADVIHLRNEKLQRPDRRENAQKNLVEHLSDFFDSIGVEVEARTINKLAWDLYKIATQEKYEPAD